jgi:hypothetical protein
LSLDPEPIAVTLRVVAELDRLGIRYLVGGSIASSVHGRPRATQDVDLVADLVERHVPQLVAALEREFYVDGDMISDAIHRHASFNVIHLATMLKVDVFVLAHDELGVEEMSRRVAVPLRGVTVWFASPEDIVLQKLDWHRMGEGVSERQWRDLVGVIEVQGSGFDVAYVRRWAERLGLADSLEKALDEANRLK